MPAINEQLVRDTIAKILAEMAVSDKIAASQMLATNKKTLPNNGSGYSNFPDGSKGGSNSSIPIGVSARHIHLCREHFYTLYGIGSELTHHKSLMGGQFAAAETVMLVGNNANTLLKARVLGPFRKATQVEVSLTDSRNLGLLVPLRDSGDVCGSAPITIIGPKGVVVLKEGCIVARRHIHMPPASAAAFGVKDNSLVQVHIDGPRGGILSDVLVRIDASFSLEMHIDTDEANALGVGATPAVSFLAQPEAQF